MAVLACVDLSGTKTPRGNDRRFAMPQLPCAGGAHHDASLAVGCEVCTVGLVISRAAGDLVWSQSYSRRKRGR